MNDDIIYTQFNTVTRIKSFAMKITSILSAAYKRMTVFWKATDYSSYIDGVTFHP